MKNRFWHYFKLFLILTLLFRGLLYLSYLLPDSFVEKNVETSGYILINEGPYPKPLGQDFLQLDNYTEAYVLNMTVHSEGYPFISSITNPYYENERVEEDPKLERLNSVVEGIGLKANTSYGRYWQGYLVVVRPLLALFTLKQIYLVLAVILFSTLAYTLYLLKNKLGWGYTVSLLLAYLLVCFWITPFSTKFYPDFLIPLIAIIYLLKKKTSFKENGGTLFFVLGAVTAFFDFFSTPLMTFALPMTAFTIIHKEEIENCSIKEALIRFSQVFLAWLFGWLSLLLANAISYTLCSGNAIDAYGGIITRLRLWIGQSGLASQQITRLTGLREVFIIFIPFLQARYSIPVLCLLLLIPLFLKPKSKVILINTIIGFLPFVWWILFSTSVFLHAWAVYRTIVISLFCIFCNYVYAVRK